MIDLDSLVVQAEDVMFSSISGGEGILLSPEVGAYFSLNSTAVQIWTSIAQPQTVRAATESIAERHPGVDCVRDDAVALLDQLVTLRLARAL